MNWQKLRDDIVVVSWNLFKIMIPTLNVVKICQEAGLDMWLADMMAPVMGLMSLPSSLAIVLTTTMLTNPYAGLLVASSLPDLAGLSVGQMSVLALFMLLTHSLPIEVMISRRTGVRARVVIALRIGSGFLAAVLLAQLFAVTGWYTEPAQMAIPQVTIDPSLIGWLKTQLLSLIFIQLIIIALLFLLELLRLIGVERLMQWLLGPFLRAMHIGDRASTIAIVGVTLGLGFGGGLLIKDVETGTIAKKDVFGVVCFINLLHSIFEDTAIVMLMGPSLAIVLGFRLIFAFVLIYLIMAAVKFLPEHYWQRFLTNHNIPAEAG